MSTIILNHSLVMNDRPLLESLARRNWKRNIPFEEIVSELRQGRQCIEPGDYLACIQGERLPKGDLNLEQIKYALHSYLKRSTDATLTYNNLVIQRLAKTDTSLIQINVSHQYSFTNPGETVQINIEGVNLFHPLGTIDPINNSARNFFSIQGFNPTAEGGGRLEVTHIGGFDKETKASIPTHIETEEGITAAILNLNFALPQRTKDPMIEFETTIENDEPVIIDIGSKGLHVPLGDTTFTTIIHFNQIPVAPFYHSFPRVINGLIIDPQQYGKGLEIKPALGSDRTPKTIITHLYDKNDKVIPVKLTVNFA